MPTNVMMRNREVNNMHASQVRTRRAAAMTTLLLALIMAACEGAGGQQAVNPARGGAADGGGGAAPGRDGAGAPGDDGAPDPAALSQRRVIKTGELTIEVDDVDAALRNVRQLADELGGHVGASEAGDGETGATLTLRIPSESFDRALERLREVGGEVVHESTSEEDVTSAIVDLEARIENLRASETTYRALLERATDIEDVLAVQSRLDDVRGQIEQLEAQAASINRQADLSTLTVRLSPRAVEATTEGWNPGRSVQDAVAALLALAQGLLTAGIWLGIVLLPLLLVIALVALVVIRGATLVRRRVPSEPTRPGAA